MNLNELKVNISFNGEGFLKNVQEDLLKSLNESVKNNIKDDVVVLPKGTTFKPVSNECNIFVKSMDLMRNETIVFKTHKDQQQFYKLLDEYMQNKIDKMGETLNGL